MTGGRRIRIDVWPRAWDEKGRRRGGHRGRDRDVNFNFQHDTFLIRTSLLLLHSLPFTAASTLVAKYSILLPFRPAIDIRPSIVMYTCAFSANALHCSGFNPVNL